MEYSFNQFRLDPERALFYKGDELLEVEDRILGFLELLLRRYPETITRRELLETLWHNQEVSDWALSQLIHRTRVLLGDNGQSPVYIKTQHGVGVHFLIAPEQVTTQPPATNLKPSFTNRWWLVIPILLLAGLSWHFMSPTTKKTADLGSYPYTIAVLPFENNSGYEDNAWVKLGLMDMVGQLLSEPAGIQTIATKDVVTYLNNKPINAVFADPKNMQLAFDDICEAMGCQVLLAARLDRSRLRQSLSYQITTKKGVHPVRVVQGETVLEAGSNLAQEVTKLIDPAQPWVVNAHDTYSTNDAANQAYALGVQELSDGNAKAAIQYLEIALQKAPDFHWAQVEFADALYRIYELDQSTKVVQTLLTTENLSDDVRFKALKVQSNVLYTQGKFAESLQISEALLGLAQKANDSVLQGSELMAIGTSYQASGDATQALTYLKQGAEKYREAQYKPGISKVLFNIGNAYFTINNYSEASVYYEKAELLFLQLGFQQYLAMARFQQASVLVATLQLSKAKKKLHDLLPLFEKLDDKQSMALSKIELAYIEILEGHYETAIQQLLPLLPLLQTQQLSYAIGLAEDKLAQAYLNQHKPKEARTYLQHQPEEPISHPGRSMIFAHLAYEEHRFADAVSIAERAKEATTKAWLAEHEALLEAYQTALASGKWQKIIL